jgi:hypothetical protein
MIRREGSSSASPKEAELACALVKVLSNMSTNMRWVISSNYLEVSAGPLLQKCRHKGTGETEHETEEPDRVDEYHRSGGGEGTLGRQTCGGNGAISIGTGELLGYLCEEGLCDDVGILLQARVADGDKSSHGRREKTDLEQVGACKNTTTVTVWATWKRTKTRMLSAPSFQFSTFSWSNF